MFRRLSLLLLLSWSSISGLGCDDDLETVCDEGLQDNDDDGECLPTCEMAALSCGANQACDDASGTATCACALGYQDNDEDGTCEVGCGEGPCSGNGTCSDDSGVVMCTCDPTFTGDDCSECAPDTLDDGNGNCVRVPPTIFSVSPGSGVAGTVITITGTNFRAGATVTVGGVAATGVSVDNTTSIVATVPAGLAPGTHDVAVTNTDTTTVTSVGAFVVPAPPTITSVSPNNGALGSSITITGTNFRAGASVTIGGVAATGVTVNGATSITATIPDGLSSGAHNVVVTNPDATTVTSVGGFTVNGTAGGAPTITPGVYQAANNLPFTINGTNFVAGATMTIGGQDANGNVTSSTTIDGTVPAGLAGAGTQYDIVITNPDTQSVTLVNGFTVF